MKKYIILILFVSFVFSCGKIDVDPTQSIAADEAIRTPNDLNQALTGCYDALQLSGFYGRHTILSAELSSDNAAATGTILEYGDIDLNNLLSNNAIAESIWSACYIAINRVNNVLYYLPEVEGLTNEAKADAEGQLYFIRSLAYYNLVNYFGAVPLKITPTLAANDLSIPRSEVSLVLGQIINDLEYSAGSIATDVPGMASSRAAKALLAKIHLTMENYDQAIGLATDVIENSGLALTTDYATLFTPESNSESIFEVQYSDQDKNRMAEYVMPSSLGGRYEVSPTEELINQFSPDDLRLNASFDGFDDKPYTKKYNQLSSGADRVYVLRLAELYLLRAEALIKSQGATDAINADINTIRNRAGLDDLNESDYDALLNELLLQRQLEFTFEGKRWFDLIRNNKATETLENVNSSDQLLFPIPLSEINTNTAIGPENQNPGY